MIIEKDHIIKLDNNNEYFVANTVIYNNENYALIINTTIDNDYLIVKQKDSNKLSVVTNQNSYKDISILLKEDLI